jgi:ribosomal-protein-alanine N-acetyltransferase
VYELREYKKSDFDELWKIDQQCFDREIAFSRPELASYIERRHSFTIVAEIVPDAGDAQESPEVSGLNAAKQNAPKPRRAVAGFITVEMNKQAYGHVITIDVRAEHRRNGLGTMLLQAAENRVRKINGFMLVLEVAVNNDAARAFYERHGFKIIKPLPRYYAHKLDGLFLTKRL